MSKGFSSQGVALLTDGQTRMEDVKSALAAGGFYAVKETPAVGWAFGGPTVIIPFRPDVNGFAAVDIVDRPWPDAMGDPKSDPMVFGAWGMGHFGPLAFPGGLARAAQQAWNWPAGRSVAENHAGFMRVRLSYVFGAGNDTPLFPEESDPVAELMFVSRVVLALLEIPGVLCYFNPNGEVLLDRELFRRDWDGAGAQEKIPLLLWINNRHFTLNEEFGLIDSVGNGQLDISDVEALYPRATYTPDTIHYYVRNVTHYLLDLPCAIETGESIDGPGESNLSWTVEVVEKPLVTPPRPVVWLYPKADVRGVREAMESAHHGAR